MFKHADRHDPVELPCNVAIVEKLEFDVVPAALKRSAFGAAVLLLRQCDSGDPRSGDLGKIKRKTAPAAADVENRGAAAYPQLCREVAPLRKLCVIERLVGVLEIGAAILLVSVEE